MAEPPASGMAVRREDYDSPWKDLLDRWAPAFMEMFFPAAAAEIDWARGYETLDKELQKVTRRGAQGRRYADKLLKVWRRDGVETWVLIHIEVQGEREAAFPERMLTYNTRLRDRYARPVASFALLTDGNRRWRPQRFEQRLWGCRLLLEFPVCKLLDFRGRISELEASTNPFAIVVLAQLAALDTHRSPSDRLARKLGLTRRLLRAGLSREDVGSLYAFLDWVLTLPEALETDYHQRVTEIEETEQMKYVTTAERIGIAKGIQQGLAQGLETGLEQGLARGMVAGQSALLSRQIERRFGALPEWATRRLREADAQQLLTWGDRLFDARCIEDVFETDSH